MKIIASIVACLIVQPIWAGSSKFWIEPGLSQVVSSSYNDGTDSGNLSGLGGGVHAFGFFSKALYAGLNLRYEQIKFTETSDSTFTDNNGHLTSAAVMLGAFWNRCRFWIGGTVLNQLTQTYSSGSTQVERTNKGKGYSLGASFWMWPAFVIGLEHSLHFYDSFTQTTPIESSGSYSNPFELSYSAITISFPFEI